MAHPRLGSSSGLTPFLNVVSIEDGQSTAATARARDLPVMTRVTGQTGLSDLNVIRRSADGRGRIEGEGLAIVEVRDQHADGVGSPPGVSRRAVDDEAAAAVGREG